MEQKNKKQMFLLFFMYWYIVIFIKISGILFTFFFTFMYSDVIKCTSYECL